MSGPVSTVPLGEVAEFVRGITFKPEDVVPNGTPNAVACMRTKNVQSDLDTTDVWSVDRRFVKRPDQYLRAGDTLVSSANSWNLVGKCSWIPALEYRATFGGFVSVLRAVNPALDSRYLYRWFSSSRMQATIRSFGRQTTNISNLDIRRSLHLDIPLPSIEEQRRIAAVLDQADALRVKRRDAVAHTEELYRAMFTSTFVLSAGQGGPNWPIVRVGDAGRVQLGRQRSPKYQTGEYAHPYMRVANIYENRIDLTSVHSMDFDEKDSVDYKLAYGDILLNEGQSTELVGRPAMWRNEVSGCCFQNTLVRFQPDRAVVNSDYSLALFLHYFRNGEFARVSSKTSNMAHLGAGRFASMPFPLPPLSLQQDFARTVEAIERLKESHRSHLAELDALFASFQSRAFRGEL